MMSFDIGPVQSFAAAVRDFFTLFSIVRTSNHAVVRRHGNTAIARNTEHHMNRSAAL